MSDWEVQVVTQSGNYKTVRVSGYHNVRDAEDAALGMTGAKRVAVCQPVAPEYQDNDYQNNYCPVDDYEEEYDDEEYYQSLDKQEMEMYDLMCQIAMEKGEQLPTISEFYEWLES
jgi:hypothetical protein